MSLNPVAQQLAAYLEQNLGISQAGAAGFLGNTQQESGFNPAIVGVEASGLHAQGLQQWEGGRGVNGTLGALAQKMGLPVSSLAVQEQQINNELTQSYPSVLAYLRTATDPAAAANIVNRQYENSGDYSNARENNATSIYQQLTGITLPNASAPVAGGAVTTAPSAPATPGATETAISIPGAPGWLNNLLNGAGDAIAAPAKFFELASHIFNAVINPENWLRVGLIVVGLIIVIIGVDKLSDGDLIGSVSGGTGGSAQPTEAQQPIPISVTVSQTSPDGSSTTQHTQYSGGKSAPYGKSSAPKPKKPATTRPANQGKQAQSKAKGTGAVGDAESVGEVAAA